MSGPDARNYHFPDVVTTEWTARAVAEVVWGDRLCHPFRCVVQSIVPSRPLPWWSSHGYHCDLIPHLNPRQAGAVEEVAWGITANHGGG